VLVVTGAASGPPIAFTGEKRDEWSYEAAFEAAAVQIGADIATPAVALASSA